MQDRPSAEWIDVVGHRRGTGVADGLLRRVAGWLVGLWASRACVDVEATNTGARRFYARTGARDLKPNWMAGDDIRVMLEGR